MINLFNKKQEKKKALSLDDIRFIATNHLDQNVKDKAGENLVNENAKNNDFHDLLNIMSNNYSNNYSLKTQISAGEKYIEYLSLKPFHEQKELLKISACNQYTEDNREKAGIKFIDNCVSQGDYLKIEEIKDSSKYPLKVRSYAYENIDWAIDNYMYNCVKSGDFSFLLSLGKDQFMPVKMRNKARRSLRTCIESHLKPIFESKDCKYLFELAENKNLPKSIKSWLKERGVEIARENINTFYLQCNYSNLKNYSYWSWVPQKIQELSKKKLEELVIEMGKRL